MSSSLTLLKYSFPIPANVLVQLSPSFKVAAILVSGVKWRQEREGERERERDGA